MYFDAAYSAYLGGQSSLVAAHFSVEAALQHLGHRDTTCAALGSFCSNSAPRSVPADPDAIEACARLKSIGTFSATGEAASEPIRIRLQYNPGRKERGANVDLLFEYDLLASKAGSSSSR